MGCERCDYAAIACETIWRHRESSSWRLFYYSCGGGSRNDSATGVGVSVGITGTVAVGDNVGSRVEVGSGVGSTVCVEVGCGVAVGDDSRVGSGVADGVVVGNSVGVGVGVCVGVGGTCVIVAVGDGVGVGSSTKRRTRDSYSVPKVSRTTSRNVCGPGSRSLVSYSPSLPSSAGILYGPPTGRLNAPGS